MGHHLTADGDFKSDKYEWCPPGFFALKFSDQDARLVIHRYAARTHDKELADDLVAVCNKYEDETTDSGGASIPPREKTETSTKELRRLLLLIAKLTGELRAAGVSDEVIEAALTCK